MLAKFKINRIDDRYLIKNFTEMFESEIQLKMPCTIEYPVITLDVSNYPSWSEVNYVYIEELKRGYFIDSYTMKRANLVDYSLRVDVLTNLANQIMAMTCMVERQEFIFSPYYVDNLLPIRKGKWIETKKIGRVGNGGGDTNFTLTSTSGTGGN